MKTKTFTDFINNSSTDNSPSFVAGTKNNKTVKSVPSIAGAIQLLGKKIGFDMNSVADQLITLVGGTKFIITDIVVTNASVNLNTAADLEVWDAVNRTGNIIANSNFFRGVDQTLPLLTSSNKYVNALSNVGGTALVLGAYNLVITQNNLYISLGVAQGVPATADIYVYGYILG